MLRYRWRVRTPTRRNALDLHGWEVIHIIGLLESVNAPRIRSATSRGWNGCTKGTLV
jgi:hypothetical protein